MDFNTKTQGLVNIDIQDVERLGPQVLYGLNAFNTLIYPHVFTYATKHPTRGLLLATLIHLSLEADSYSVTATNQFLCARLYIDADQFRMARKALSERNFIFWEKGNTKDCVRYHLNEAKMAWLLELIEKQPKAPPYSQPWAEKTFGRQQRRPKDHGNKES